MFKVINLSNQSLSIAIIKDEKPVSEFLGREPANMTCFSEEATPGLRNLEKLGLIRLKEVPTQE